MKKILMFVMDFFTHRSTKKLLTQLESSIAELKKLSKFGAPIIMLAMLSCSKNDSLIPTFTTEERPEQKQMSYPGIKSISDNGVYVKVDFVKLHNSSTGEVFENGSAKFFGDDVSLKRWYCPTQCAYNQNFSAISMNGGYVKINGVKHNETSWDATN